MADKKSDLSPSSSGDHDEYSEEDLEKIITKHPNIEREFDLKLAIVRNKKKIKLYAVLFILLIAALITVFNARRIYQYFIPPVIPDADNDGVPDGSDICAGFDDRIDVNQNGIPDGCDEKPPDDFTIDLLNSYIFPHSDGTDVLLQITNRFPEWGLTAFMYQIHLKDSSGEVVLEKRGTSFILPLETKYILELDLDTTDSMKDVEFEILSQHWGRIQDFNLNLGVSHVSFIPAKSSSEKSTVTGTVENITPFGFENVHVIIVARDASSAIIGATRTLLNTLSSGQARDFRVLWDFAEYKKVKDVNIDVTVNFFESENYIKQLRDVGKYLEYEKEEDDSSSNR